MAPKKIFPPKEKKAPKQKAKPKPQPKSIRPPKPGKPAKQQQDANPFQQSPDHNQQRISNMFTKNTPGVSSGVKRDTPDSDTSQMSDALRNTVRRVENPADCADGDSSVHRQHQEETIVPNEPVMSVPSPEQETITTNSSTPESGSITPVDASRTTMPVASGPVDAKKTAVKSSSKPKISEQPLAEPEHSSSQTVSQTHDARPNQVPEEQPTRKENLAETILRFEHLMQADEKWKAHVDSFVCELSDSDFDAMLEEARNHPMMPRHSRWIMLTNGLTPDDWSFGDESGDSLEDLKNFLYDAVEKMSDSSAAHSSSVIWLKYSFRAINNSICMLLLRNCVQLVFNNYCFSFRLQARRRSSK